MTAKGLRLLPAHVTQMQWSLSGGLVSTGRLPQHCFMLVFRKMGTMLGGVLVSHACEQMVTK